METETELWELVGDRWTMPVLVKWEEEHALVTLAPIPLLEAQRRLAVEALEPIRVGESYVTTRENLGVMARKSHYANPEDVVEWRRRAAPALHFPKHAGVDEFLDAFMDKGIVQSRATLSAIYSTLCAHMLQWLLAGKPLPLIFATIYPLLYRRNWKEMIHYHQTTRSREIGIEDLIVAVEDTHAQRAPKVEGMGTVRIAAWSLNLVHEKMFHDAAQLMEHRLRADKYRGDIDHYWENVRGRLKRQFDHVQICIKEYREAVREKSVALFARVRSGKRKPYERLKPYRRDGRLYTLTHLPFWRGKREESGKCGFVVKTDAGVSTMYSVQSKAADLRNARADVPGSDAPVSTDHERHDAEPPTGAT